MREKSWLAIILGFYLLLGMGYSVAMPVWEAPDEVAHYRYALKLAKERRLPSVEENYEAMQPPAYYLLAATVLATLEWAQPGTAILYVPAETPENITRPLPVFHWNRENFDLARLLAPLLLRWLGVVAGAGALLLIYRGTYKLFPDRQEAALAATALVAGTPQFLHITASVSNDVLAIVAGAFLFRLLATVVRGRPLSEAPSWLLLTGVTATAILLPVVVKLTVMPAAIGVLAAIIWRIWVNWRRRGLLLLGAFLLVVAVPTLIFLLVATPGRHLLAEFRWRLLFLRPNFWQPVEIARRTALTYWGYVGWVAVPLPRPWLRVVVTLAGAGALMSLPLLCRGNRMEQQGWRFVWLTVLFAILIFVRNAFTTPAYQGRFLFPVIGPLSLLAAGGWAALLPERARALLIPAVLLLMTLFNLVLWLTGILPVYYQPWLD